MLEETLAKLLSRVTEFSVATGDATDGSTTTLEDTSAVWEATKWKDAVVEITQSFQVVQDDGVDAGLLLNYDNALRVWQIRTTTTIVGGSVMTISTGTGAGIAVISVTSTIHYYVTITSNDANTLTFPAIAVAVVAGDHYEIRLSLRLADIDKWGGTAVTPRDISLDLANLSKLIPIAKAAVFNTALLAAEDNWLGADIEPTNSPSYLRIYACVSVTGILRVARTIGGTTLTEDLNSGTALVADAAYMFTVPWRTGDSINIRYSVTTGTIKRLLIEEIGGAE